MGAYLNALSEQKNPDVLFEQLCKQQAEIEQLEAENKRLLGIIADAGNTENAHLAEIEKLREGMRSARKTWFEKALKDRAEIEYLHGMIDRVRELISDEHIGPVGKVLRLHELLNGGDEALRELQRLGQEWDNDDAEQRHGANVADQRHGGDDER